MYRSVKVTNSRNSNYVGISLCLNHYLATSNRIRIECYSVYTTVSAGLRDLDFTTVFTEFLFKNFTYEILKVQPIHSRQICSVIKSFEHFIRIDKTFVLPTY